jgi:DNA-directed RNA polymerase specialized sigma24 family protein
MPEGNDDPASMDSPRRKRAFATLIAEHYPTLHEIAQRTLRAEQETAGFGAHAIAPTSLVTETVIRFMGQRQLPGNEDHLRGLASVFMTRVIADRRRARLAEKRGARVTRPLDSGVADSLPGLDSATGRATRADLALLENAMIAVARTHPRQVEVITLHSVAGIPLDRVAAMLGISGATAARDLQAGRERLARRLKSLRDD